MWAGPTFYFPPRLTGWDIREWVAFSNGVDNRDGWAFRLFQCVLGIGSFLAPLSAPDTMVGDANPSVLDTGLLLAPFTSDGV